MAEVIAFGPFEVHGVADALGVVVYDTRTSSQFYVPGDSIVPLADAVRAGGGEVGGLVVVGYPSGLGVLVGYGFAPIPVDEEWAPALVEALKNLKKT